VVVTDTHHTDSFIPAVLTAATAAAGRWLLERAQRENRRSMLDEVPAIAELAAPQHRRELVKVMNTAAAACYRELCGSVECPIYVTGFVPPEHLVRSVAIDDTALRYFDSRTGRTELWYVNLKHECRKDTTGADVRRLAGSKSFWNSACGVKAADVEHIIHTVIAQRDAGRTFGFGVLAFVHGPRGFVAGDTEVLAYDPVVAFAWHRGELTPSFDLCDNLELVDRVDHREAGTFTMFPRASWLVQADHRRAVEVFAHAAPALVREGHSTHVTARAAVRRWNAMLKRRMAEDEARHQVNHEAVERADSDGGWSR